MNTNEHIRERKLSMSISQPKISSRWTYENTAHGSIPDVPELFMFGTDDIRKALPLENHSHPGCFELVYVQRGRATWELLDTSYETRGGDIFHTRPDEWHSGGFKSIEPSKIWWMLIQAPQSTGWLCLPEREKIYFQEALYSLPRVIQVGTLAVDAFSTIRLWLEKDHFLRSTIIRQAILEILLLLIQTHSDQTNIADDLLDHFNGFIARMKEDPAWRPSVQQLADEFGISASHFHKTFQAHTGLSPMSYIERTRLKEASRLLTETQIPVTEIAHHLGYQTSQHFATVFKRYMGRTPSQWRAMINTT
jgi:AraC-like DNA-binding protein